MKIELNIRDVNFLTKVFYGYPILEWYDLTNLGHFEIERSSDKLTLEVTSDMTVLFDYPLLVIRRLGNLLGFKPKRTEFTLRTSGIDSIFICFISDRKGLSEFKTGLNVITKNWKLTSISLGRVVRGSFRIRHVMDTEIANLISLLANDSLFRVRTIAIMKELRREKLTVKVNELLNIEAIELKDRLRYESVNLNLTENEVIYPSYFEDKFKILDLTLSYCQGLINARINSTFRKIKLPIHTLLDEWFEGKGWMKLYPNLINTLNRGLRLRNRGLSFNEGTVNGRGYWFFDHLSERGVTSNILILQDSFSRNDRLNVFSEFKSIVNNVIRHVTGNRNLWNGTGSLNFAKNVMVRVSNGKVKCYLRLNGLNYFKRALLKNNFKKHVDVNVPWEEVSKKDVNAWELVTMYKSVLTLRRREDYEE